ncbi:MAG: DUF4038 domain-containing protein [Bryobacterales bacterium]|nr:DUF4038 domain-containing protein [Bryobacterales bacterium]
MKWLRAPLWLCLALPAVAQMEPPCPEARAMQVCDIVFEMPAAEGGRFKNPYLEVNLQAEFRSPKFRTFLMPGFWDGGTRYVIRITPVEAGEWLLRVSSNVKAWDGQRGQFQAAESDDPGFLQPANLFHWKYTEKQQPHLWMGDTCYTFAWIDRGLFDRMAARRAAQKFTHMRGLVMHPDEKYRKAFFSPDEPDIGHFQELDRRVRTLNENGLFVDLVLAGDQNHLVKVFPEWKQRERFLRYMIARYAPFKITWQGVQEFEEYDDGRALLKEMGLYLKANDPFHHPRGTHTVRTSAPLLPDGWMTHILYQSSDDQLGAIERQIVLAPRINAEFGYEDSGAGKSHPHHVDSAVFKVRLWNAVMNGQYPTYGNTGTYGGKAFAVEEKYLDAPGAKAMTDWFDFMSSTRYWDLEPYFDVTGGRALYLAGVEYIVFLEKGGAVELATEKKGYKVYWFNVETGELIAEKKEYKGERFSGTAPGAGPWVLHLSRDGRKESMLRSYYFESRRQFVQEVESNAQRVPYEVVAPEGDVLRVGAPVKFAVKVKRETKATSKMMYLWTAEATSGGQGYRAVATGHSGEFTIPRGLTKSYPAVLNLRVYGMNANGKVYALDRVMKLAE